MNLLQYAITLTSFLFNLENLCVMSSGSCRSAICTFLISRFSVGVLTSVAGQLDGSCVRHCGPFHHSVDVDRVAGSTPLEIRSARLDWDGTCLYVAEAISSWMMTTLFPTNVFHLWWTLYPSVKRKYLSMGRTHYLCCLVSLEGLAPPPNAIWVLVVELFSLKTGWCGRK